MAAPSPAATPAGQPLTSQPLVPLPADASVQAFRFKNDGPTVHVDGSPNRTVWFEVFDEYGETVGAGGQPLACCASVLTQRRNQELCSSNAERDPIVLSGCVPASLRQSLQCRPLSLQVTVPTTADNRLWLPPPLCPRTLSQAKANRTLMIVPSNDPPVFNDIKNIYVNEEGFVEAILTALDPEGDIVTFSIGCMPANGTITPLDGPPGSLPFQYTSNPGASGTDSFVVIADDGKDQSFTMVMACPDFLSPVQSVAVDGPLQSSLYLGLCGHCRSRPCPLGTPITASSITAF